MADRADSAPILGAETLYAIIGAVAHGPDLDRVLPAVVDLLVEATSCHACFVYLLEDDVLRIRAASPVYAHVIGAVEFGVDEGLTGWVARHRTPAFIRDHAMDDPRMRYVPELDEERFQSMVAVPLLDRAETVIGVVVLHTEAPREFGQDVLDFLAHVASLVAGAIDNARLYEQTVRQLATLTSLTELSEELASLTGREDLYVAGCRGVARLLDCQARLVLLDASGAPFEVAATPPGAPRRDDTLVHAPSEGRLAVRLTDQGQAFGVMEAERHRPFSAGDVRMVEACAHQLAVALRKAELIERLAGENLIRDVFEALEQHDPARASARARTAGWDPSRPHVVAMASAAQDNAAGWSDALGELIETRLRWLAPSTLCDIGSDRLRALVPLTAEEHLARLEEELDRVGREHLVVIGLSQLRRGITSDVRSVQEADAGARIVYGLNPEGGARRFDALGIYRYLAPLAGTEIPDHVHARAIATLDEYDRQRRTELVVTLDRHLTDRGGVLATAKALVIHPNTLRQRLRRIEELTGLELDREDLLSLEVALKLHQLKARTRDRDG